MIRLYFKITQRNSCKQTGGGKKHGNLRIVSSKCLLNWILQLYFDSDVWGPID
jgi:hypothetical protein